MRYLGAIANRHNRDRAVRQPANGNTAVFGRVFGNATALVLLLRSNPSPILKLFQIGENEIDKGVSQL